MSKGEPYMNVETMLLTRIAPWAKWWQDFPTKKKSNKNEKKGELIKYLKLIYVELSKKYMIKYQYFEIKETHVNPNPCKNGEAGLKLNGL